MRKKENFFVAFFIVLILSLFIFGLSKTGILFPVTSITQKLFSPFQGLTYGVFNSFENFGTSGQVKKLEAENIDLASIISDEQRLKEENSALLDQFKTADVQTQSLLPAQIVGAPGFIPGFSVPETFIINKGTSDGVESGDTVVYKNNLVGRVSKVEGFLSQVSLVTNSSSSFTAKTSQGVLGVIKGQGGGQMILDNVLLSDNLSTKDLVLTNGDTNLSGGGFPPGLVVGKIVSVDKRPSDLFQRAMVTSFLDFSKLTTVFVIK